MSNRQEKKIEISVAGKSMDAFVAQPAAPPPGRVKAVVVVQEAYGVNSHIEEVCRRLAREGYLAIAPEFFHRSGRGLKFGYDDFSKAAPVFQKLNNAEIAEDMGATLATLEKDYGIPAKDAAVMGFCLGGFVAMLSACRFPIATAISYYGGGMVEARPGKGLSPIIDEFKSIRSPVLLFFGKEDQHIPQTQVQAIEDELKSQRKTFEVIVYPGAGHAFSNDERSSYHQESSKAAWKESMAWLKRIGS